MTARSCIQFGDLVSRLVRSRNLTFNAGQSVDMLLASLAGDGSDRIMLRTTAQQGRNMRLLRKTLLLAFSPLAFGLICSAGISSHADAQEFRVYQGRVQMPDFRGRDRSYATYQTRIANGMRSGPNFAGRYAVVEIGCGTGCRFVVVGNVATGQLFNFPYGGEEYQSLWLTYNVKSNVVEAQWVSDDRCNKDTLRWNGVRFASVNRRVVGGTSRCNL